MRGLVGLLIGLVLSQVASATGVDISAGAEYFVWEEFADNGDKLRDETGTRQFIGLRATNHLNPFWSSDFGVRVLSGTVDYDDESFGGNNMVSDTDYNGYKVELGFQRFLGRRRELVNGVWQIRFAFGTEYWRRSVQDGKLSDGTKVDGFVQRFYTNYATVAANYRHEGLWAFGLGAKAPFYSTLELDSGSSNISVHPEGQLSLFAGMEVYLARYWSLALNYDSYRYAKSDTELGLYQPESRQDTLAMALHYRF